ncbi:MAG: phasin family protein [Eubacteriaceae bacterium]|jgi:polyhydroxyalkanoate synthesis regulator phasin
MAMDLSEELKKVFLAGVGAVSMTAETASKLTNELIKKGEMTVEQGKAINEELKNSLNTSSEPDSVESVLSAAGKLTPEQKQELIDKLTADK